MLQTVPGFADFAGFAGVVEITQLNTSKFYLDELWGNELVFILSFVSSKNYRAIYPNAHKACL